MSSETLNGLGVPVGLGPSMFGERLFGQFVKQIAATPSTVNGSMPNKSTPEFALSFKTCPLRVQGLGFRV